VAGFGWIGMMMALSLLFKEAPHLRSGYQYTVLALLCINIIIPSYNAFFLYADSLLSYPYPGLYRVLDSLFRTVV
jgi:hypothetical protein